MSNSQKLTDLLLRQDEDTRRDVLARMSPRERLQLSSAMDEMLGSPHGRYRYDPVGFVEDVLGETLWSKQRQILESVRDNKRTVVPACHAPGKSHIAARAVAWWVSSHAPGTAVAVTTATTFRQVRAILWQHIRRVATRHNLPGEVLTTEWKIDGEIASFGFSASDNDEAAVQGIHVPHLLIVVDEAGGIASTLGQAFEALMTGSHTRLLAIGNPATDQQDSWFEKCCGSHLYNVIPIDVWSTPNFTGEDAGICHACPTNVREHPVSEHLVDQTWVDEVVQEFGEDSPFVVARVNAKFPRASVSRVIPLDWAEQAQHTQVDDPLPRIRLGVDVASDGGDEFVIAKADGMTGSVLHSASGAVNSNAVDVARVVLEHILQAELEHRERGVREPVRVKIDAVGVGWGVVSLLDTWKSEGQHDSEIVGVKVSERASNTERFANQRAEMWWNMRMLLQPVEIDEESEETAGQVRLSVDRKTLAQLAGPKYKSDSAGRVLIERKTEMKQRGVSSPDKAEALLLAFFEPPQKRKAAPIVAPIGLDQKNPFQL